MQTFPDLERIIAQPIWLGLDLYGVAIYVEHLYKPSPIPEATGYRVLYMTPGSFIHCELEAI